MGDDSSEGVTEGFVEGAELVDEIEVAILDRTDLGHQILIVVVAEPKGMQTERTKVFILGIFEHLPEELVCVMRLLAVGK